MMPLLKIDQWRGRTRSYWFEIFVILNGWQVYPEKELSNSSASFLTLNDYIHQVGGFIFLDFFK